MRAALTIPAGVSIVVVAALYSKVLGAVPLRDILTLATLFLPLLVFPASLCGLYLTLKREKTVASKVGLGAVHLGGLAAASFFVHAWWNFGIPVQR